MNQITIQPGPPVEGLDAIEMENELLRLVVLPEAGAKVWQIHYKPLGADLLWNHPSLAPSRQALYASYDDTWSGGWDELFPNDEAGQLLGYNLPDHGELWTGEWQADRIDGGVLAFELHHARDPFSGREDHGAAIGERGR